VLTGKSRLVTARVTRKIAVEAKDELKAAQEALDGVVK
jgi:hypothetical protein